MVLFLGRLDAYKGLRLLVGATWDGFHYFMRHIREILDKRKVIQRNRKIKDAALYTLGLMASLAEAYQEYTRLEKLEAMKQYG